MAHIALSPRAHRKILDAQQYTPIYCGASMRTEPVRMALEQAHAFVFDKLLCRIGPMLRHLVPVADVEIAHADEVVGEFAGKLVAGYVLDLDPLQIKNVRHRKAG